MHVNFTEKELEWIVMEPFNWHVASGAPDDVAKRISEKLAEIDGQTTNQKTIGQKRQRVSQHAN